MPFFALFNKEYIVTANPDGTIPVNAKVVLHALEINLDMTRKLIEQANAYETGKRK